MEMPVVSHGAPRKYFVFFICLTALLFPNFAGSMEQTGNCHCFRDRVFDPAERFKADTYLLTTVGNSLIAFHFNISKRQVVMMKMQGGTENNDLVIALYLHSLTGIDVKEILAEKEKTSWQDMALTNSAIKAMTENPILNQIRLGETGTTISAEIYTLMLQKRYPASTDTLAALQRQGLAPREQALVLALSEHTGVPPQSISSKYKTNHLSWSEIAYNFGLQPGDAGKLVLSSASPDAKNKQ